MPTPDHSNGAPCWIDLMTSDAENAKAFYGTLFGWTFQTGDEEKYGGYITASRNGKTVAGMMQKDDSMAGMPDMWSTYLRSEDAAATVQAATQNGGQVFMGPMDVPDQGPKAGIMDASGYLPAEVPSNWQIYFAVEDADATIEKAVSMGARVIDGPDDSPFGRLATLADPTGAMFKIVADTGQGAQAATDA
jgi:predicted enzyme related to lactoylglutathione lyase